MSGKLSRVSPRKVAANRRNSLKSTGPNTPQGKIYSRRNALKHGLFAMELFVGDLAQRENPQQYEKLLGELAKDYQPVGTAEHLEVERIAACWWKLGRAWRYENAQIAIAHTRVDEGRLELLRPTALSELPASEYHARLDFLRRAEKEIEATGKISA